MRFFLAVTAEEAEIAEGANQRAKDKFGNGGTYGGTLTCSQGILFTFNYCESLGGQVLTYPCTLTNLLAQRGAKRYEKPLSFFVP